MEVWLGRKISCGGGWCPYYLKGNWRDALRDEGEKLSSGKEVGSILIEVGRIEVGLQFYGQY